MSANEIYLREALSNNSEWAQKVKMFCRDFIKNSPTQPTLEEVISAVRAKSRAAIPVQVKSELMSRIQAEVSSQSQTENQTQS